jgi:hypothetical protein
MMVEWLKHVAVGRATRNKKKDYRNGCLDGIFIILIFLFSSDFDFRYTLSVRAL